MNPFKKFAAITVAALSFASFDASAAIDPAASVVLLRKSCGDGAGGTLPNCFTSLVTLNSWRTTDRTPGSGPLTVEISAGSFSAGAGQAAFSCDGGGLSLKGSGPDRTTLVGGLSASGSCSIDVQDLTMTPAIFTTIYWANGNGGRSTWTNVNIVGGLYAWTETACAQGGTPNQHFWFSSRLSSSGKTYVAACGQHQFWGSEILASGPGHALVLEPFEVFSEVNVYGSTIRTIVPTGVSLGSNAIRTATVSGSGAKLHIHGTGIDIVGNELPNNIASLVAGGGGEIHANSAAYNLSTAAGGVITRILNNGGNIHASYLWEEDSTPPNIVSQDGADMAVVTTPGLTPRLVVYSTTCPSKWFDVGTNACRP